MPKLNKSLTGVAPKMRRKPNGTNNPNWKNLFIDALCRMPNVAVACEQAHVSRTQVYQERLRNKGFGKRWEQALTRGTELLEAQCWKRASVGTKRGVWMKDENGKPVKVDEVTEYSDTLAIFLLKAHNAPKYRETIRTELGGVDGKAIEIEAKVNEPINFNELRSVAGTLLGFAQANGNGQPVHSAETNGQTSLLPEPGRS